MSYCSHCGSQNVPVIPSPPKKVKTTRIDGGIGSKAVWWLIDGKWEHKGWLMPQVGSDE